VSAFTQGGNVHNCRREKQLITDYVVGPCNVNYISVFTVKL